MMNSPDISKIIVAASLIGAIATFNNSMAADEATLGSCIVAENSQDLESSVERAIRKTSSDRAAKFEDLQSHIAAASLDERLVRSLRCMRGEDGYYLEARLNFPNHMKSWYDAVFPVVDGKVVVEQPTYLRRMDN